MSRFNQRQPALYEVSRSELREASMWVVAAGLRVSEVVALKVTADAISRFVQFFQTRLAPLPRYRASASA
jgi:site-specific recombinase XerD